MPLVRVGNFAEWPLSETDAEANVRTIQMAIDYAESLARKQSGSMTIEVKVGGGPLVLVALPK